MFGLSQLYIRRWELTSVWRNSFNATVALRWAFVCLAPGNPDAKSRTLCTAPGAHSHFPSKLLPRFTAPLRVNVLASSDRSSQ